MVDAEGTSFVPWSWSNDGKRIAGHSFNPNRVYVYDLESGNYSHITPGGTPSWLKDDRRVVFARGDLYLADTVTKKVTAIRTAETDETLLDPRLAHDDRLLFYVRLKVGADIRLMKVK